MEGKTWTENRIEYSDFNGQSIEEKTRANPKNDYSDNRLILV